MQQTFALAKCRSVVLDDQPESLEHSPPLHTKHTFYIFKKIKIATGKLKINANIYSKAALTSSKNADTFYILFYFTTAFHILKL
jgi:hypothetical protein